MKIKIKSLGCRLNQAEIESVSTALRMSGHEITVNGDADIVIINSCAVTRRSEKKVNSLINASLSGRGEVVVTGCASGEVKRDGRITYISNDYKYLIPEIIQKRAAFSEMNYYPPSRFDYPSPVLSSTVRANLKIQDGCDNFCSYCVIPFQRGAPQSKPAGQAISELRELIESGFREIILTGVNTGKYDDRNAGLASLIETALGLDGEFRLHITSLNPDSLNSRLVSLFSHPKMVKHLHLSLQSGSGTVLERMKRPYKKEDYIAAVSEIRGAVPGFNLTTDIIVGFPDETDREFEETLRLARDAAFSHIHTFRYSPRPGTAAFEMGDNVSAKVKRERSGELIRLSLEMKADYFKSFNGGRSIFLSEHAAGGVTRGFNEYYAPIEVEGEFEPNRFLEVVASFNEKDLKLSGAASV